VAILFTESSFGRGRCVLLDRFGETEVEDFRVSVHADHRVGRLEITADDMILVRSSLVLRQLGCDA